MGLWNVVVIIWLLVLHACFVLNAVDPHLFGTHRRIMENMREFYEPRQIDESSMLALERFGFGVGAVLTFGLLIAYLIC